LLAQALTAAARRCNCRLAAFGKRLSLVVLAICALIFGIGVLRGEPVLLMALTAISLAVAAIPEALPAVVTVLLALGARRLVRLMRWSGDCRRGDSGLGEHDLFGQDRHADAEQDARAPVDAPGRCRPTSCWRACVLCNDASAQEDGWIGDPTETALMDRGAAQHGIDMAALQLAQWPRCHEWPFDAERKRMSTLHRRAPAGARMSRALRSQLLPRCDWRTVRCRPPAAGPGRHPAARRGHGQPGDARAGHRLPRRRGPPVAQQTPMNFERGLTLLGPGRPDRPAQARGRRPRSRSATRPACGS
jgi:magnesium-transporting ATPase (P-type)